MIAMARISTVIGFTGIIGLNGLRLSVRARSESWATYRPQGKVRKGGRIARMTGVTCLFTFRHGIVSPLRPTLLQAAASASGILLIQATLFSVDKSLPAPVSFLPLFSGQ
jgi:hypothetical protein